MTYDAFQTRVAHRLPGRHSFEPGLTDRELLLWEKSHPALTVPDDLLSVLRRSNGFRIRLNPDSPGGAALRLLPVREMDYAAREMYGGPDLQTDHVPMTWLNLTQEQDSTFYLVLDLETGKYLEVEPITPDEAEIVAEDAQGMLDWFAGHLED